MSWTFGVVLALGATQQVSAQCTSNASSCISCHETQALRPVLGRAQKWHVDHGFGDLCAACHGGNPADPAQEGAHAGLRSPLADPSLSCRGCHEQDYALRAAGYMAAPPSGGEPGAEGSARTPPQSAATSVDALLAGLAALLAVALVIVLRPLRARPREWPRRALDALRFKRWNPVIAGAALGVLVAASELWLGRPLAAAGAFDKLAAYAGRYFFPASTYYRYVVTPGISWQVWLMVGVLAGSFASSWLAGEARLRWLPDVQWIPRFGKRRAVRFVLAFAGSVLVQVGAGIAGGCTSGLAISGGSVLAPGAFLFIAGMFAGGVPTARLWHRRAPEGRS